jgi:hypothetical protein
MLDLMLKGGIKNPNLMRRKPRNITADERSQLIAFLKSLKGEEKFEKPQVHRLTRTPPVGRGASEEAGVLEGNA